MAATHYANHDNPKEKSTGGVSRSTAAAAKDKERESEDLLELMGFFSSDAKPGMRARPPLFRR